jgi:Protein of unknown function (DUF4235)
VSKNSSMSRPISTALGITGGLVAGVLFKQTWRLIAREDDTPDAGDLERGWAEVIIAATIQGAIAGAVKAALNRSYLLHRADDDETDT